MRNNTQEGKVFFILLERVWGMEQTMIEAIAQLGFPVAAATFLIWFVAYHQSKRIDALANKIDKNTEAVTFLAVTLAKANGFDPAELRRYVSGEGGDRHA